MSETSNKTRLEHDCIGQMEVPANVYWGIHTQRAIGNFPVSGITDSQHPELIRAYATVKKTQNKSIILLFFAFLGVIFIQKRRRIPLSMCLLPMF